MLKDYFLFVVVVTLDTAEITYTDITLKKNAFKKKKSYFLSFKW